jgi:hypothetical protein
MAPPPVDRTHGHRFRIITPRCGNGTGFWRWSEHRILGWLGRTAAMHMHGEAMQKEDFLCVRQRACCEIYLTFDSYVLQAEILVLKVLAVLCSSSEMRCA